MSQVNFVNWKNCLGISSWEDVDGSKSFTSRHLMLLSLRALQPFLAAEQQRLGGVLGFQGQEKMEVSWPTF